MLACGHIAAERERDDPATVIAAAKVAPGQRVLDVSTETGGSVGAAPDHGTSGRVIGADISPAMVEAEARLNDPSYLPATADGQKLPFSDGRFDAVVCQLGLQFFRTRRSGCATSAASCVPGAARRSASSLPRTARRCGASLPR